MIEQRLIALERREAEPPIVHTEHVLSPVLNDGDAMATCIDSASTSEQVCLNDWEASQYAEPWQVVASGKSRKLSHVNNPAKSSLSSQFNSGSSAHGKQRVLGTGTKSSNDSTVKSGVSIIQKTVVHVNNLDVNCTEALLTDYLLAHDVQVVSYYKAKSWLKKEEERSNVTAFRVCILASHRQKIFSLDLWDKGVIIRDWKFKKTQNAG